MTGYGNAADIYWADLCKQNRREKEEPQKTTAPFLCLATKFFLFLTKTTWNVFCFNKVGS